MHVPLKVRLVFKGRNHGYHGYGKARAGKRGGGAGLVHDARLGLRLLLGLVLTRRSAQAGEGPRGFPDQGGSARLARDRGRAYG